MLENMRGDDEYCQTMEDDMTSVARDENYIMPNINSNELVMIENNALFVQVAGISDAEQINILRNKHGNVIKYFLKDVQLQYIKVYKN